MPLLRAPELLPAPDVPTAVAVPGLGLTVDAWRAVAQRLAAAVPTAVLGIPSAGLPADRDSPVTPVAQADRLARRLAERGLLDAGPVVLLGHSASCQAVAETARRHPSTVRGLVLVGPTTDPHAVPWPRLIGRWLATAAHEDPRRFPEILREYLTTRLAGFLRTMRRARFHDLRATLAGSRVPVLVLRGPHDHIAPSAWLAELARTRPGIEVATLPGGAHMVPVTHPVDVARRVRCWAADAL
ncbi:alpha/beta fold hydrolase [Actinomycetospora cinnamomea]|uniref:Pimeloyl-ACP methyl ester carboxylesterase n=1 Tax=Actinomycetospora cinnamomea TaxID=663609 RepID=A0A2U1FA91_9PSEU|nr:alpha/beta fold hydrolase [Actinomycetospora cinnamomea]PVZ09101.1 pimeloyl-ACP methyl ester carboxylesterase [Actinomycetospora cinnamomea]